jgi:GntR family transcriptional regulator, arabinose operon transcriptional repressor
MYTRKVFEQVRDLIEADIQEKKPGDPICTEAGYARQFGVSRPTVRKSVEELVRIGMVRRVPGKGLVIATQGEVPNRGKLLIALPHEVGDGFLFKVMLGCVEQANALGFDYKIIGNAKPQDRLELVRKERLADYAAVITCCYEDAHEYGVIDLAKEARIPVLLMDNPARRGAIPCIQCNDYDGGYKMGSYLASKGHRNIVNLSNTRPVLTIERRDQGFLQALADSGVEYDPSLVIKCSEGQLIDAFLERFSAADFLSGRYTAICSHTSLAIVEVSRWLFQHGIRIYEDVSLMGYGDHPYLPMLNIPCTIIGVPGFEMGRRAVDEIGAALLGNRPVQDVRLEVWLEKRHTVKTVGTVS